MVISIHMRGDMFKSDQFLNMTLCPRVCSVMWAPPWGLPSCLLVFGIPGSAKLQLGIFEDSVNAPYLSTSPRPLRSQQRIDVLISPNTIKPIVLNKMRLFAHTQANRDFLGS
ncbi:hypothetical protein ABIE13_002324 [Ottowia thiooxydans]|uniref:Uncharacterized protein n=1 Tax=Ottowia thiooxydans TaxID=219182 RepID=A0ABV2Q9F5_9BURK